MRRGKQRATTAGELDETMTARHDFSPDNVEHSSSLAHRAMTPQYADALMCSHEHEQTVANTLLSSKQAGASGTSVMHADLAQPTSMLLAAALAAPVPGHSVAALEQLFASPCPHD